MLYCWKKWVCGNLPLVVFYWIFFFAGPVSAETGYPGSPWVSGCPLASGPFNLDIGQDTSLCLGDSLLLEAFHPNLPPNVSYLWSSGATTSSVWVNSSGTYSVTVTNSQGNVRDSASVQVIFLSTPFVELGFDTVMCPGDSILLSVPPSTANYLWSTGDTTNSIYARNSGKYRVEVSNAACSVADSIYIAGLQAPFVALGIDTSWCGGLSTRILDANPANLSGWTFLWSDGSVNQTLTVSSPGSYAVTVTAPTSCVATDEIKISLGLDPQVNINGLEPVYCQSDPNAWLSGSPQGGVFSGNGLIGTDFSPADAGAGIHPISYLYTDTAGCQWRDTAFTEVVLPPDPANAGPDLQLETFATQVQLAANTPNNGGRGMWNLSSGSAGFSDPLSPNSTLALNAEGSYLLSWIISSDHCPTTSDQMEISISAFAIPNGFSPNGDGVNDQFVIRGLENLSVAYLRVFNRWGSVVYETATYRNTWNGNSSSGPLPEDTYFYTLDLGDQGAYNGIIQLKR